MKIFAYSGGSHCAGMTLLENGKPVFAFEEERFNRIKAYKDYYNHHFRIPVQSTAWAKKEFNLLYYLMTIPGRVFTREEIISEIWQDAVVGDRTIDVHVRKIREKIGSQYIKTIKGVGYKFDI